MEGGKFESTDYGFAKASKIMNTNSLNDFRWSVRLTGGNWMNIGIASGLQRTTQCIINYDENAIIYHPYNGNIFKNMTTKIHQKTNEAENGDEIHFRFQPKLKKFSISFVCSIIFN